MPSTERLLRMEAIDKSFPGVHAVDHIDFDLNEGEVHVLLGENGAGKSTLVKIISGSVSKDSGKIFIRGQEVLHMDPERAQELGIGMVYQEFSLIPALTVAENIFLGQLPKTRVGSVDWKEIYKKAEKSLVELGVSIDPQAEIRQLNVAEQQLTEIARVLTKNPRILVLDEPTSALSDTERDHLFEIIDRLRGRGVGIIYISHRLNEVPLVGQRVTVLRDGRVMGTMPVDQTNEQSLITMMVGRQLNEQYPKQAIEIGQVCLRVEGLSAEEKLEDISFELHKGEVLGIFGLMGAGQEELAHAIFGLAPLRSGRLFIDSRETKINSPTQAIRHGIGLLTRDRREGLVPMLPIPANITLAELSQYPQYRMLRLKNEQSIAGKYVAEMRIVPADLDRAVLYLSGGNQQKVVLARWLFSKSKILIFDEPTRGIDVGAKAEVFSLMNQLAAQGVGIIMISSEMPEILAIADRILVMRGGRFSAEYPAWGATQEDLLRYASILNGG